MALKVGYSMTIYDYDARFGNYTCSEIQNWETVVAKGDNQGWRRYSGNVYCLEVPEHHIVYVRRQGKPVDPAKILPAM